MSCERAYQLPRIISQCCTEARRILHQHSAFGSRTNVLAACGRRAAEDSREGAGRRAGMRVWRGYGGGMEGGGGGEVRGGGGGGGGEGGEEGGGGGRVPAVLSSEKVSICETLAAPEIVPFLPSRFILDDSRLFATDRKSTR